MTKHFLRDLDRLRRQVLVYGRAVETALEKAITALIDRKKDLAAEVIDGDKEIDEREVDIEAECLKVLALHQPVAQDLRFLVTVLKVNNDLERIGDLAVNLAERAVTLSCREASTIPPGILEMSRRTKDMVRESLDTLFNPDTEAARRVIAADDAVDDLKEQLIHECEQTMHADASQIEAAVCLISAARDLERVADLATNIAEDVVFLVDGDLIRHAHRFESADDE
jgi:phosphate transport system protein